ncbi:hypothetical protein CW731_11780 [Polaribacter sp. ALD11]|uniref:DUF11 domain-containing protein n=1 Tax=Polaribacter sp. ALD11 TaxID=2058137 RepID=UPI000C2FF61C|nr:DUF11 domain-containing protein [Polaribacter sp. ALD11]AUC85928.1 hypothetical protein CW731_11780 [Polaribacter sp. ALD11]
MTPYEENKNSIFSIFLIFTILFLSTNFYAQLDSEHYLPPLKQVSNNAAIQQQAVYFSTPETIPFTIEIYKGNSATAFLTINGLAKGVGKIFDNSNGLGDGDNNITLVTNANTGEVLSNSGLRIIAPGGQKFYVNYRGRSGAQAGSLTSKGSKAKGTDFRWGGIPNRATNANLSTSLGMMATEDGTVVTVSGYDTACKFRKGNARGGIIADTQTIILNKGQSFVLEAAKNETTANIAGWLGSKIESTKPIVISNGGLNVGIRSGSQSRDVGIDQPVAVENLGREYVFVRANGTNETEFPIIVATQNNTQVFAGGNLVGVINDGEYLEVPGSYYSSGSVGASMYVTTSREAYAYQCLQGAAGSKIQTIGMNFIAPVNCLLPNLMDEISDIDQIAGTPSNISAITIIASTLTANTNIKIRENGVLVPLPAPIFPAGTSDWKTFYVPGLEGEIDVTSTGPIAVGTFMSLGNNAGLAGYFSGFDTVPVVGVQITGGGCFPAGDLEEGSKNFDAYQWYRNDVLISGATSAVYSPTSIGEYNVVVTEGTCSYSSKKVDVYNCDPDIVVKKTSDVTGNVTDGDTVNFTVTVQSFGVNPVTNLVIKDIFPTQLDVISVTPSQGVWTSPDWTVGNIEAGQLFTLKFVSKVPNKPQEGTFTNVVSNTQDQVDSNDSADDLVESFTIVAKKIDLSIIKTVDKAISKVGGEVIFTLTLKNKGPQSATGVQVIDLLPAGLTYVSGNSIIPINTTYNGTTGVWNISGRTIVNGETIVLKIAALVTSNDVKLNRTEVFKTDQKDADSSPNNSN